MQNSGRRFQWENHTGNEKENGRRATGAQGEKQMRKTKNNSAENHRQPLLYDLEEEIRALACGQQAG
jgi:hypothetical protein